MQGSESTTEDLVHNVNEQCTSRHHEGLNKKCNDCDVTQIFWKDI